MEVMINELMGLEMMWRSCVVNNELMGVEMIWNNRQMI